MKPTVIPLPMNKQLSRLSSFIFVNQPIQEKENSQLKPAKSKEKDILGKRGKIAKGTGIKKRKKTGKRKEVTGNKFGKKKELCIKEKKERKKERYKGKFWKNVLII